MSLMTPRRATFIAMVFMTVSGCGYFQGSGSDNDSDLSELDVIKAPKTADKPAEHPARDEQVQVAQAAPPQEGTLELKVNVNEPFPMTKTVEQRLTETDSSGVVSVSTTRTDMMLSLNVDKIHDDGRKEMTVRYHRVQYSQDIRGIQIAYSSDKPTEPIPKTALLYAGLADNWFSFVVGPNNKVAQLVGFNDFLQRCLRKVPAQDVASVRQQLEATTKSEDGIATFIDDSLGLLPYSNDPAHPGVAIKEGSKWDLEPRHSDNPLPMYVTTTCTLNDLSANSAEILLAGRISGPPTPVSKRGPGGVMKILVKGGFCTGSCRVDRKTGLPTQSRIQRFLELTMELPNGQKIEQSKETLSTITSFLNASQQPPLTTDQRVEQTNFQQATGSENHHQAHQAVSTLNK